MTDHGTIFHPSMVKALWDGRKTQTRRMINPQPEQRGSKGWNIGNKHGGVIMVPEVGQDVDNAIAGELANYLPYALGDRLYVKEGLKLGKDGEARTTTYALDGAKALDGWKWQLKAISSRYMPKALSRMTLHLTAVRVERLQAISQSDALLEGIEMESADPPFYYVPGIMPHSLTGVGVEEPGGRHAERSYGKLMDFLHGTGFWASNPWVAVLTFDVERVNIGSARP